MATHFDGMMSNFGPNIPILADKSLLALMVKGWFQQFLVNAAGPLVLLIVLIFLPESFRWYLSSGRIEEGIEALKVYGHSFLIVCNIFEISLLLRMQHTVCLLLI